MVFSRASFVALVFVLVGSAGMRLKAGAVVKFENDAPAMRADKIAVTAESVADDEAVETVADDDKSGETIPSDPVFSFVKAAKSSKVAEMLISERKPKVDMSPPVIPEVLIAGIRVLNHHLQVEDQGWIVMMEPETTDAEILQLCRTHTAGCSLEGHPSEHGVPFFKMEGTEKDVEAMLSSCNNRCGIRYVEPDGQVSLIPEAEEEHSESLIETGWEAATWGLDRIGANFRSGTGAGITIFILDTGVRVTHREFGGRAVPGLDFVKPTPFQYVDCNGDMTCAPDRNGHGTHCAGSAAGATYGVAPSAEIRSLKVLADNGHGLWSQTYAAFDWIAASRIRPAVASASLGGVGIVHAMADTLTAAVNAGVVVVVAAGNNQIDACGVSPAYVPAAITVGATNSQDQRMPASNYGSCVDIWAPGVHVRSAGHTGDTRESWLTGTSMACPHVAGAAALVLQKSPSKKSQDVLQELIGNAIAHHISDLRNGDSNYLLYVGERKDRKAKGKGKKGKNRRRKGKGNRKALSSSSAPE